MILGAEGDIEVGTGVAVVLTGGALLVFPPLPLFVAGFADAGVSLPLSPCVDSFIPRVLMIDPETDADAELEEVAAALPRPANLLLPLTPLSSLTGSLGSLGLGAADPVGADLSFLGLPRLRGGGGAGGGVSKTVSTLSSPSTGSTSDSPSLADPPTLDFTSSTSPTLSLAFAFPFRLVLILLFLATSSSGPSSFCTGVTEAVVIVSARAFDVLCCECWEPE